MNVIEKVKNPILTRVTSLFKREGKQPPTLWSPEEIEDSVYAFALESVGLNPPAGVMLNDHVLAVQGFAQNNEGLWSRSSDTYIDLEGEEKRTQYTYESALNIAAGEVVQGKPRASQLKIEGLPSA